MRTVLRGNPTVPPTRSYSTPTQTKRYTVKMTRPFTVTEQLVDHVYMRGSVSIHPNLRMKVLICLLCLYCATSTKGTIIGIDLGTTHSSVAVYQFGMPEIIINGHGSRVTPSYVAFTPEGERLIGQEAKNQASLNPSNTVFNSKRLIGRTWSDPFVQKHIKDLPFTVVEEKGKPYFKLNIKGKQSKLAPEEISAMVLRRLRETAESYLGHDIKNAIVTVPAYFNNEQRQATIDAGRIAGLNIIRTISEPTAAAIAYGLNKHKEENVLVFDFGGGTLDVSILTVDDDEFTVLAVKGNPTLGGEDFNERMVAHFMKLYKNKYGKDASKNSRARGKLRKQVEQAKISLSFKHQAKIDIEAFYGGEDYSDIITRTEFEEINEDLFLTILEPIKDALKDANLNKGDIDEIVLVGGSTRIPKVQKVVQGFFDGRRLNRGVNPDEAIALGAAAFGRAISRLKTSEDMLEVFEVCPISLGTQVKGGGMSVLIPRNTKIPTVKTEVYTTTYDEQPSIEIDVYQGEHKFIKHNLFLGTFILHGIEPAPKGVPKIEVTFEINTDGILIVTAKNRKDEHQDTITITNHTNQLTNEDIDRMIRNAEEFEKEDKLAREKLVARNKLIEYIDTQKTNIQNSNIAEGIKRKHVLYLDEKIKWLKHNSDTGIEELKAKRDEIEKYCNSITLEHKDELTAAAIAYGLNKHKEEKILVFDFGGGTLDVSILKVNDDEFAVLAVKGNSTLGGEDFNERMVAHFMKLYKNKHGKDASKNSRARGKLRKEVEQAKISLSFKHQTKIDIEAFHDGKDYSDIISRAEFEEINKDLFLSVLEPIKDALKDAKLRRGDIDEIVLVGGSTRIPKIQKLVQDFFDGRRLNRGVNPDEAVAIGAAAFAKAISRLKTGEDQDELLVFDVCPISLGIELNDGTMSVLIPRNTRIPTVVTDDYTTAYDNHRTISINVYQGERKFAKDNLFLGAFELHGIEPAPKGVPKIDVTFEINIDGILIVTAKNRKNKHQDAITITNHTNQLTNEDIDRMIRNAEEFEKEDKLAKEILVTRNKLIEYIDTQKTNIQNSNIAEGVKRKHVLYLDEKIKWLKHTPDVSIGKLKAKRDEIEKYCNSIILDHKDEL